MSSIKQFVTRHPRLTAWFVLAVGMVVILVISARDVGLLAGQWAALIVATILVAGLCVWIIGWEDKDEEEEKTQERKAEPEKPQE
jgi:protein-S-isoprenylcysteine O-methyltransferase Ste14